jgi:ATP-dependent helicase/nuclease subunit B
MPKTIIVSAAAHRRLSRARQWLELRSAAEEVVVLGSTLEAANEMARLAVSRSGSAFGWHRMSLAQFAAVLARPALQARQAVPLGDVGAQALAARVVHVVGEAGGLGRYAAIARMPGFPRAIARSIAELRLSGLGSDAVRGAVPELGALLQAYEQELNDGGFTDWAGTLRLAAEATGPGAPAHSLLDRPLILLDPALASEAERMFVTRLLTRTTDAVVTVPAADEPVLRKLQHDHGIVVEDLDRDRGHTGSLDRLQRQLFVETDLPIEPLNEGQVSVFSAPGEGRECVEIARRMLRLAEQGVPFDRMAVVLRAPQQYRRHLEEVLARARIPACFVRGALRPDPAGRAFCVLLRCAREGLSARRFAEYLSLGQVPDAQPDGTPPDAAAREALWVDPDDNPSGVVSAPVMVAAIGAGGTPDGAPVREGQLRAPRRWEQLLVDAAVIGGRERWERRLQGLAHDLRIKLQEIAGDDETRAAGIARMIEDLSAFTTYTLPLIDALHRLPRQARWGQWLDELAALASRALHHPERMLSLLCELAPMAEIGPVGLDEILLVLSDHLMERFEGIPDQRYGRVLVGPIESVRGSSFHAVFIPALAEKAFPRKIVEEPILLDETRRALSSLLETNEIRLANERLALALACGAAEQQLFLSYPRLDLDQGRPRVSSFYALEAIRPAEGHLPDFAELARRAETSARSRIGWPAPAHPERAIDDAEYDLAQLNRIVADNRDGSGRYLVSSNANLGRALRMRYQRWIKRGWTPSDGLIGSSETLRTMLARHRPAARSYSPTALQNLAKCPYRFFLQAIVSLAPKEVPEAIDELDPLQRGSLIHDIQFALFQRLEKAGLLPVRSEREEAVRSILEKVIAEISERYHEILAPAIERVWEDGIAGIRADLIEWLRRCAEDRTGYVPWRFELSFGLAQREERHYADPASLPDPVALDCGIRLRGSIDLVERHPNGRLRVTDHKTGKSAGMSDQVIAGGQTLQPVLYALAAEKMFKDLKVDSGRLYFCTSAGLFTERSVSLDRFARQAAELLARTVEQAVADAFLPAAPGPGQCAWCDYRAVCGPHEERRSARKNQAALGPLLKLRETP